MLYRITYLNILTGLRCNYMQIGFETEEAAQRELFNVKREKEKNKHIYTEGVIKNCIETGMRIPSCVIGIDWKIEEVKTKNNQ